MTKYFNCSTCTEKIKKEIDNVLSFDITEVTLTDYMNKISEIVKNKELIDIKNMLDNILLNSKYTCDGINHICIRYGNDGPFIYDSNFLDSKSKCLYSILLNPENDTFRYIDE